MEFDDTALRRYLLGDLSEETAEEISVQLMSDEKLEECLELTEQGLFEDYLDDELSVSESELFHKNFLISDERISQLRFVRLLREHSSNTVATLAVEQPVPRSLSFVERLTALIKTNVRPLTAAVALITVVVLIGLGWRFLSSPPNLDRASIDNYLTKINSKDLTDISVALNDTSLFSLSPGSLRSGSTNNRFSHSQLKGHALFRLALPASPDSKTNYRVQLSSKGKELFSPLLLPTYSNPNGSEIRLIVPASLLPSGDYEISILREGLADPPIIYLFSIQ